MVFFAHRSKYMEYYVRDLHLVAPCVPEGTSVERLQMATGAFLDRVQAHEMPPYTPLNIAVLRALVNHEGALTEEQVSEILAFFEREKHTKEQYTPTLDAAWRVLGWRPGDDLDQLLGDADLASLHQFLAVLKNQPPLRRNATYLDRALYALYRHPLFETLYDPAALTVVNEQIQFRLLCAVRD